MAKKKRKTRTGRGVDGRPGRRYELTDAAWERIEPLLPKQRRGGKRSRANRSSPPTLLRRFLTALGLS